MNARELVKSHHRAVGNGIVSLLATASHHGLRRVDDEELIALLYCRDGLLFGRHHSALALGRPSKGPRVGSVL